jgi:hypothetical protein
VAREVQIGATPGLWTTILSIDWFDGQVAEQFDIEMRKHGDQGVGF